MPSPDDIRLQFRKVLELLTSLIFEMKQLEFILKEVKEDKN